MKRKSLTFLVVEIVTLALLLGCQPDKAEFSFESIERNGSGKGRGGIERWEVKEPGLLVVATPEELPAIDDFFTEDAQTQLRKLDFDNYLAVAVFLGHQNSGHEGIEIERVVRQGDRITVHTQVGGPGPQTAETSPYHLIALHKEGNWDQIIYFLLYLDGEEVVSLSHFVP